MTVVPGIEIPIDRLAALCPEYHIAELAVFGSARKPLLKPRVRPSALCDAVLLYAA